MTATAEAERTRQLAAAEDKAEALFAAVTERGLVAPGLRESQVSDAVRDLGAELFGTRKHWHKRVVRSGPNTLQPYRENPPDRTIAADDIVFLDFGPIFAEWEADFGRTYVLGDDPVKHRPPPTSPACSPRAATTSTRTPTSRVPSCTRTSSAWPKPRAGRSAARTAATSSASSRTS